MLVGFFCVTVLYLFVLQTYGNVLGPLVPVATWPRMMMQTLPEASMDMRVCVLGVQGRPKANPNGKPSIFGVPAFWSPCQPFD